MTQPTQSLGPQLQSCSEEDISYHLMVEALEVVAATPNTRGVYVLDEQDMQAVRTALRKVAGEQS